MKKILALALCLSVGGLAVNTDLSGVSFGKKKNLDRVEKVEELTMKKSDAIFALSDAVLVVRKSLSTTLPKSDKRKNALASLSGIKKGFTADWKEAKKGADAATVARIGDDEFNKKMDILNGLIEKMKAKTEQFNAAKIAFEKSIDGAVKVLVEVF